MSDPADRLREADRAVREVEGEIESVGEREVEAVADAYDRATTLLLRYEGSATGTGSEEFRSFVKFQEELGTFVEDLDEDLRHREAFEEMEDRLDKRRVSKDDFEHAREALAEPASIAELLEEREQARREYHEARKAASERVEEIDSEIEELEEFRRLGEADLEAPVEQLREPIEAYNEAVREAFETFKREESARDLLAFVEATREFPLVEFRQPPDELREYVRSYEAGTEPVPTLLEYSEYSRSKLNHYVEDAAELKRRVTTQQTYLRRLDADPLVVGWPPPTADRLRFRAEELVAVCARFAPESVVERARTVQNLPHRVEYRRLRDAAVADDQLDEEARRRLEDGQVREELSKLRDRRETLTSLLEELPDR